MYAKLFSIVLFMSVVLALLGLLSGCSGFSLTEDFADINGKIAQSNTDRFKAFADGMVGCGDDAACKVALAMAYSGRMGQQEYFRPETTSDILKALLPYASLGIDVARLWRTPSGSGDGGGFIVTGDGNSFSGIGNDLAASEESSIAADFASDVSFSAGNRDYKLGGDIEEGTVTDEGVQVEPEAEAETVVE